MEIVSIFHQNNLQLPSHIVQPDFAGQLLSLVIANEENMWIKQMKNELLSKMTWHQLGFQNHHSIVTQVAKQHRMKRSKGRKKKGKL